MAPPPTPGNHGDMSIRPVRPGLSLLELALVLCVLAIGAGIAGPSLKTALDTFAVIAARDALVASLERTRAHAIALGGARLRIDSGTARCWSEDQTGAPLGTPHWLGENGVSVEVVGAGATPATLSFDAMGLGRLANRTIRLRRGNVTSGVVVSAYGRPRAW